MSFAWSLDRTIVWRELEPNLQMSELDRKPIIMHMNFKYYGHNG